MSKLANEEISDHLIGDVAYIMSIPVKPKNQKKNLPNCINTCTPQCNTCGRDNFESKADYTDNCLIPCTTKCLDTCGINQYRRKQFLEILDNPNN